MQITDLQKEILDEIKKIAVDQSTLKANIESYMKQTDKHEVQLQKIEEKLTEVNKHGVIIKGMLWVYGLIVSLLIGKYITNRF